MACVPLPRCPRCATSDAAWRQTARGSGGGGLVFKSFSGRYEERREAGRFLCCGIGAGATSIAANTMLCLRFCGATAYVTGFVRWRHRISLAHLCRRSRRPKWAGAHGGARAAMAGKRSRPINTGASAARARWAGVVLRAVWSLSTAGYVGASLGQYR